MHNHIVGTLHFHNMLSCIKYNNNRLIYNISPAAVKNIYAHAGIYNQSQQI